MSKKNKNKVDNNLPTLSCPENKIKCQPKAGLVIKLSCPANVEITLQ
jgi:hypothetical protein